MQLPSLVDLGLSTPLICMMELRAETGNVSMHAYFKPITRSRPLKGCIIACPAARGLDGVPGVDIQNPDSLAHVM